MLLKAIYEGFMIDNIEIDSFKIRMPIYLVDIIDESIKSKWLLVNELTGIMDEANFKNNSISYNLDGIKTKFGLEVQKIRSESSDEFLIILINSKILKKRYFQGITKNNIKFVYKYLISLQAVYFDFETFLNSEITDVDFKRDTIHKDFIKTIPKLYELARLRKEKNQGCKKYITKNNQGIEFSDRKTTSIKDAPFLKIL